MARLVFYIAKQLAMRRGFKFRKNLQNSVSLTVELLGVIILMLDDASFPRIGALGVVGGALAMSPASQLTGRCSDLPEDVQNS